MFITDENFRDLFSNLMDDDLYSWKMVSHSHVFNWLYVCNEVLVPNESGAVPDVKYLMMRNPFHLDTLVQAQAGIGRVLSVLLMKAPTEGGLQYRSCTVQRVLRFQSASGDPRHVYEIDDQSVYYSNGIPSSSDKLEVIFDAGRVNV